MPKVDIEQRHAQHRAVGGDERQENAQQAIQGRAGFPHHHLGKLHHNRNDQNKGQGAQVEHVQWDQDPGINQPCANGGHRHYEGGRQPHAHCRLQLFGDAHKRAQAKELHQYEVINQHSSDKEQ